MRKTSINPPGPGILLKPELDQGCTQQDAASALGLMEKRVDKLQLNGAPCPERLLRQQRGTEFVPPSPKPPMRRTGRATRWCPAPSCQGFSRPKVLSRMDGKSLKHSTRPALRLPTGPRLPQPRQDKLCSSAPVPAPEKGSAVAPGQSIPSAAGPGTAEPEKKNTL